MVLLSHTATAAALLALLPFLTSLAVAGDWILYRYLDSQCQDDYLPTMSDQPNVWAEEGIVSTCVADGGNSWGISSNGGCVMRSWSGGDCRGESTPGLTGAGCRSYPYGSISVDCPGSTWEGEGEEPVMEVLGAR
jgi:hypothetical protein